jgi:hypothetical protein
MPNEQLYEGIEGWREIVEREVGGIEVASL